MKYILLFLSLLLNSVTVFAQSTEYKINKDTQKLIKEISKIIKGNSIFRDSLNWKEIETEISSLPLGDNDSIDQASVMHFFIAKLRHVGDKHSFFLTKRMNSFVRNQMKTLQPNGLYLDEGIGLIKVPYCLTLDNEKDRVFANAIRGEIKKIDISHNIFGWIVDLRQNVGGNMWPMLAGLNALIDDGIVGYFITPALSKENTWISKNGRINFPMRKIDNYKVKNPNVKIAVLIDSMTASSGEMTAISFIGLPNVKVFGQPSAGLTTGNTTYQLSDGSLLNLATTYVADRTKKRYLDKIIPDVIINPSSNAASDQTVETAKKWLLQIDAK